jgi:hypothetical protein
MDLHNGRPTETVMQKAFSGNQIRPVLSGVSCGVTALAPDEGERVADVFYRLQPHPQARIQLAMVCPISSGESS